MNVGDLIEGALYLSIKDRYFNALPTNQASKEAILAGFLPDLNQVLVGIGKRNPAYSSESISTNDVLLDNDLSISYIQLNKKYLTLFRVEFLYSGSSYSITLTRLGMNDFFSNSSVRTVSSFPSFYNYNVFSDKLYLYPTPSVTGEFNIFGKERIGPFTTVDEEFPDYMSETFFLYLEYYFAKFICSQYNAPWQAQKEDLLRNYAKLVDSENNIAYQEMSVNDGKFTMPVRNVRTGL